MSIFEWQHEAFASFIDKTKQKGLALTDEELKELGKLAEEEKDALYLERIQAIVNHQSEKPVYIEERAEYLFDVIEKEKLFYNTAMALADIMVEREPLIKDALEVYVGAAFISRWKSEEERQAVKSIMKHVEKLPLPEKVSAYEAVIQCDVGRMKPFSKNQIDCFPHRVYIAQEQQSEECLNASKALIEILPILPKEEKTSICAWLTNRFEPSSETHRFAELELIEAGHRPVPNLKLKGHDLG